MDNPVKGVTSPAPRDVWTRLLAANPDALAFQTPEWLDCVCAVCGYEDASCLFDLASGHQVILPIVRRRFARIPLTQASLPYGWGFGGVVAADELTAEDLAAVLASLAARTPLGSSLRPNPLASSQWTTAAAASGFGVTPRLAHALDLEGGFERVWTDRFTTRGRRHVRRAEREGVVVECDATGRLIPVFYELYQRSIDRWARQAGEPLRLAHWRAQRNEPLRKYQTIAERMGEACRVYVARVDGRPAAASIVLFHGTNASYWRGAMDKELAGPARANFLLHSRAIQDACLAGCHHYHMGESGDSTSLAEFKEAFGAVPYSYVEYYLERLPFTPLLSKARKFKTRLMGGLRHLVDRAHPAQALSPN